MLSVRSATLAVLVLHAAPALCAPPSHTPDHDGGHPPGHEADAAGVPGGGGGSPPTIAAPAPSVDAQGGTVTFAPLQVTSDSWEYCKTLSDHIASVEKGSANAPRQAEELAREGHDMCNEGLIRGGLVRLRRALLMLRGGN